MICTFAFQMTLSISMTEDIKKACEVLHKGGLILYPTDTIWGIGCDATNEEAVKKAYQLKRRADSKAMLILMDSSAKLNGYVSEIPDLAYDLIEMTTKPLTLIYPGAKNLPACLVSEDGSIGIRITTEAFSHRLCERFRRPLVSTSANRSGMPSPTIFDDISEEIKNGVDYIVEYRQDDITKAVPSGIIKIGTGGLVQIIRE